MKLSLESGPIVAWVGWTKLWKRPVATSSGAYNLEPLIILFWMIWTLNVGPSNWFIMWTQMVFIFYFLGIRLKWFECSWFIYLFRQFKNSRSFASYQQLPNYWKRSVYSFIWIIPYPSKMMKRWVVDQSLHFQMLIIKLVGLGHVFTLRR